ncbi:reverse transcriptase domain-containing protein [Tanacetum coccineum]
MEVKETTDKEPKPDHLWKLYTDGASSSDGSRAGLMLVSPEGKEYTYALRFSFETTNNEADYEALLAGLRIVAYMKVQDLTIFVDSQLLQLLLLGARSPRSEQKSRRSKKTSFDDLLTISQGSFGGRILPNDPQKARKLRIKAPQYRMIDDNLYRKSYLSPWMQCVGPAQAKSIIQEIHQGSCGMHARSRLTISPNVEVSFFKLLCTTDDIEDMTFDVYALPCYGLVLFVMALFIHAL